MELKKGFQNTEIGKIPLDWEIKKLGSIVNYTNGAAHEQLVKDFGDYIRNADQKSGNHSLPDMHQLNFEMDWCAPVHKTWVESFVFQVHCY